MESLQILPKNFEKKRQFCNRIFALLTIEVYALLGVKKKNINVTHH